MIQSQILLSLLRPLPYLKRRLAWIFDRVKHSVDNNTTTRNANYTNNQIVPTTHLSRLVISVLSVDPAAFTCLMAYPWFGLSSDPNNRVG